MPCLLLCLHRWLALLLLLLLLPPLRGFSSTLSGLVAVRTPLLRDHVILCQPWLPRLLLLLLVLILLLLLLLLCTPHPMTQRLCCSSASLHLLHPTLPSLLLTCLLLTGLRLLLACLLQPLLLERLCRHLPSLPPCPHALLSCPGLALLASTQASLRALPQLISSLHVLDNLQACLSHAHERQLVTLGRGWCQAPAVADAQQCVPWLHLLNQVGRPAGTQHACQPNACASRPNSSIQPTPAQERCSARRWQCPQASICQQWLTRLQMNMHD
jgi:hypothetical protein